MSRKLSTRNKLKLFNKTEGHLAPYLDKQTRFAPFPMLPMHKLHLHMHVNTREREKVLGWEGMIAKRFDQSQHNDWWLYTDLICLLVQCKMKVVLTNLLLFQYLYFQYEWQVGHAVLMKLFLFWY